MDYRLVRQYANNSFDNIFNFFYKIADFFTVMIDCLWAFYDIWYCFAMIFINLFSYLYFLFLFLIDKLTFSRSSMFWRKTFDDSGVRKMSAAYSREHYNPVSGMYGKVSDSASRTISAVSNAVTAPKISSPVSAIKRPEGARRNLLKEFAEGFVNFMSKLFKKINEFGEWFKKTVLSKLNPVREEEPQGRKSLVESYMKDYQKSKHR